ncbi:hypothetical protein BS47DRAFT_895082 [Hydnum rufescens UP504]|uniref:Anoctamin transmembrane domain-containing protein n=1 Tax=Hydnum rufescens UP504 TaxID=1448309 RepID=A0A9P6DEJ4_9AGAM|nr:hypothetical protein BS47DRAFT_895082 [Hydnum rufescens UP504]
MQCGYCVMWSSCWPLTPAMTLLLAAIRLRTDAFKILTNIRRSISSRAAGESSRIWISTQSVIIWAGAITHVAVIVLVDPYLRTPASHRPQIDILALVMQVQAQPSVLLNLSTWEPVQGGPSSSTGSFISVRGFFVMLLASHGVIVFKRYVQHILHSIEGAEHSALPAGSTLSTKKKNRALRQLHCGFDSRSLPQLPHLKSKTRVTEVLCWRVL